MYLWVLWFNNKIFRTKLLWKVPTRANPAQVKSTLDIFIESMVFTNNEKTLLRKNYNIRFTPSACSYSTAVHIIEETILRWHTVKIIKWMLVSRDVKRVSLDGVRIMETYIGFCKKQISYLKLLETYECKRNISSCL